MTPKQLAIISARQAGKELKKLFLSKNFDTKIKSKYEIVTSADKLAEKLIIKNIQKHFPDHQILSEEIGWVGKTADYLWVIDPLDGTTNFFMHNPIFSTSISLFYKKEPILGVIYGSILDEMYVAEKNKGAFCNNKRLKVSKRAKLSDSFLTYCHGSKPANIKAAVKLYPHFKLKAKDIRQLGSAALELCYVARGVTDAIMIPGALRWDVGAGVLMVREAGGIVTDFKGKEWNFNSKSILASNGKVPADILKVLKKI